MKFLCNKRLQQKLPDPFPLLRNGVWPRETRPRVASYSCRLHGRSLGYEATLVLSVHLEKCRPTEMRGEEAGDTLPGPTNLFREKGPHEAFKLTYISGLHLYAIYKYFFFAFRCGLNGWTLGY